MANPSSQYGPPNSRFGSTQGKSQGGQSFGEQPQNTYGTPREFGRSNNVDTQYGPPRVGSSGSNQGQGQLNNFNAPSSQYGPPNSVNGPGNQRNQGFGSERGQTQSNGFNAPHSQYGPPTSTIGFDRTPGSQPSEFGNGRSGLGRPDAKYGPPDRNQNVGSGGKSSFTPGRNNFGSDDPASSYGPPPSGNAQGFNDDYQSGGNFGTTGGRSRGSNNLNKGIDTAYGPPDKSSQNFVDRDQKGNGRAPSSTYGAPRGSENSGFADEFSSDGDSDVRIIL